MARYNMDEILERYKENAKSFVDIVEKDGVDLRLLDMLGFFIWMAIEVAKLNEGDVKRVIMGTLIAAYVAGRLSVEDISDDVPEAFKDFVDNLDLDDDISISDIMGIGW